MIFFSYFLCALAFAKYYKSSDFGNRAMLAVLFVSTSYYGFVGPLYWHFIEADYFLDVYWGEKITSAATMIIAYSIFYGMCIVFRYRKPRPVSVKLVPPSNRPFWILFGVACFSMAYVLIKGVALGGLNRSDPLILVFYQFSDLFIPVLLYSVAKKRFSKFNLIFISLFTTYAISVGFRYKLVLLYFPLILLLLGENVGALKKLKRRTYAVVTGCAVLVLFSLMTLTRKKFSGLDFSALEGVSLNLILYGLFAESNIIFGLLGILSEFLNKSNFIYLQPIIDSVLELVPRFFLPDRITGAYLVTGAAGLVTDQAMKSGTAYPYFGEFLSMGGHAAGVIGVIVYASLYRRYAKLNKLAGLAKQEYMIIGAGILAVFFGYYNFSRGYLPQSVKGFIFVVMPYYYLIARHYKRMRVSGSTDPRIRF